MALWAVNKEKSGTFSTNCTFIYSDFRSMLQTSMKFEWFCRNDFRRFGAFWWKYYDSAEGEFSVQARFQGSHFKALGGALYGGHISFELVVSVLLVAVTVRDTGNGVIANTKKDIYIGMNCDLIGPDLRRNVISERGLKITTMGEMLFVPIDLLGPRSGGGWAEDCWLGPYSSNRPPSHLRGGGGPTRSSPKK